MDDTTAAKTLVRAVGAEPAHLTQIDGKTHVEGLAAPTGVWVEIDSAVEGNFMERLAEGCFVKTTTESIGKIRAIFHHGKDSSIGFKVLGPIESLEEGEGGLRYRINLLDTQYNAELRPGIEAGLYGTSFKGQVVKRNRNMRPPKSEHNPKGLPEYTYTEVRLHEFGLTPLPVYEGTTATMRSLADDLVVERLAERQITRDQDDAPYGLSRSRYDNILRFVGDTPWAMEPSALTVILAVINERSHGYKASADEVRERIGLVERAEPSTPSESPVRVIDIIGPIVPRADLLGDVSGMTSVAGIQAQLRDALASDDVERILLNIDSPGGSVSLIPELADEIRAARDVKPITAVANTMAASAAYWLGAQASEFYVSPSGVVGSVGVYTAHDDMSAMNEKLGVSTSLISAGEYKTEGNPYEPLTDEARGYMQNRVDQFYDMFTSAVAKGRGTDKKTVQADYGKGRTLLAHDALSAGMVDGVASFDQTLSRLEKTKGVKRSADSESERSVATTRTIEPEPSVATTRKAPAWGKSERPYWML